MAGAVVEPVDAEGDAVAAQLAQHLALVLGVLAPGGLLRVEPLSGDARRDRHEVGDASIAHDRVEAGIGLGAVLVGQVPRAVVRELVDADEQTRRALRGVAEDGTARLAERRRDIAVEAQPPLLHRPALQHAGGEGGALPLSPLDLGVVALVAVLMLASAWLLQRLTPGPD